MRNGRERVDSEHSLLFPIEQTMEDYPKSDVAKHPYQFMKDFNSGASRQHFTIKTNSLREYSSARNRIFLTLEEVEEIRGKSQADEFLQIQDDTSVYNDQSFEQEIKNRRKQIFFVQTTYVREKTDLERIIAYSDKFPYLNSRKRILIAKCKACDLCQIFVKSKAFEGFILIMIICNTIMLCLDDPTATESPYRSLDDFFLGVYTVEMGLKIFAMGLIFPKEAYLKFFWNWIDFVIVITGYLPFILTSQGSINITGLRVLRVLRPLRAISFLEELKSIINSIVKAIPNFLNVMLIYGFFLCFFGISALQLFVGTLKKRCFEPFSGILLLQSFDSTYKGVLCGGDPCPDDYVCGKIILSPNYDITNFDNIFWSIVMIFQTFTQWFNVYYLVRSFNYYGALIFFILCSLVGVLLLLNLMISIISTEYNRQEEKKKEKKYQKKKKSVMPVEDFKRRRLAPKYLTRCKGLRIDVDFSIEYQSESCEDVLKDRHFREKEKKHNEIDKILRTSRFEIIHKPMNYHPRENEKEIPKWVKRTSCILQLIPKKDIDHLTAKKILWNRKRMNLPLIKTPRLINFLISIYPDSGRKLSKQRKNLGSPKGIWATSPIESKESLSYKYLIQIIDQPIHHKTNKEETDEILDYEQFLEHIKETEAASKIKTDIFYYKSKKFELGWPGEDVNIRKYTLRPELSIKQKKKLVIKVNKLIRALNSKNFNKLVWLNGFTGKCLIFQKQLRRFTEASFFEYFFMLAVLFNTVLLCLDGLLSDKEDNLFKTMTAVLTFVFVAEMVMKVTALGISEYISSKSNILDSFIVVVSVIEQVLLDSNSLSAFRSIRVFRIFRMLRVVRLLSSLKFMGTIIAVLYKKFFSFLYLFLILLIYLVMYSLVGEQLYAGKINKNLGFKQNFDSFYFSFLATFQLLTITNWADLLILTMNTDVYRGISILYLISCIIIGSYIFMNLFIGILINGFVEESHVAIDDEEEEIRIQKEVEEEAERQKILKLKEFYSNEEIFAELMAKKSSEEVDAFEGIECKESLFMFSKKMRFRKLSFRIVSSIYFDNFILIVIIFSSIKLALDTYDLFGDASTPIDWSMNILFMLEATLKIVSYGLLFDQGTYLRNGWNVLDFVIVIISLIDMALVNVQLSFQKIFRLLRILRPLRFITHNENLKLILTALFDSVLPLIEVMLVILLIFLIFAIFGMSFMQENFGQCLTENYYNVSKKECQAMGAKWTVFPQNFDNIFQSLLTMFIISTLANWNIIMYYAMDSNSSDYGPAQNNNEAISLFFMASVLCLGFVMVNLFIGVLCYYFGSAQNSSKSKRLFLTQEQKLWINLQKFIPNAKSELCKSERKIKKDTFLKKFINSRQFDLFIMFCIISNAFVMSMNYEGAESSYNSILENFNYAFTAVFSFECAVKMLDLGLIQYFKNGWNKLDFTIVFLSLLDIFFQFVIGTASNRFIRVGPQIVRIFRIVRVVRVLKLIKRLERLKKLLESLIISLPDIFNVALLLVLFYYIYAVLGVFLFKDIKSGTAIDKFNNFSNFFSSCITLLGLISGQTWAVLMFDCFNLSPDCTPGVNCGTIAAPFFFISFIVIGIFIVQNLFVLVLLGSLNHQNTEKPKAIFERALEEIRKQYWETLRRTGDNVFRTKDVLKFLLELKPPLGFQKDQNAIQYHLEIMRMEIRCNKQNHIDFNDLLFSTLKRVFARNIYVGCSKKTKTFLHQIEEKTKIDIDYSIKERKLSSPLMKIHQSIRRRRRFTNALKPPPTLEDILLPDDTNKIFLNTLINTFYCKMAFKSLKRNAIETLGRRSPTSTASPKPLKQTKIT